MAAAAATRDSTIRVHVQLKLHILSIFNWLLFEIVAKTMSKLSAKPQNAGKIGVKHRHEIQFPFHDDAKCQEIRTANEKKIIIFADQMKAWHSESRRRA